MSAVDPNLQAVAASNLEVQSSAKQVVTAVQKAVLDGKRSLVKVPLNKDNSFPHRIDGYFGAEALPYPNPDEAAKQTINAFRKMMA